MTAYETKKFAASRCPSAAACSSARINSLLDTALWLAVSICIIGVILLPCFA